jgi:CheY-like chemotaxis protein
LLQEFQSDEQLRNVPVLVLTADIVQARALQEQGQTVLLKPVSVTRLQEILSKFQDLP